MIEILNELPESLARFRSDPWQFQQTFKTPLKELQKFVKTVLTGFELTACSIGTHEVVFAPDQVLRLFTRHSIRLDDQWNWIISVSGPDDIRELLATVLSDWIDFSFVLEPESFAIYADHDEYCTFYAKDESTVGQIKSSLIKAGFQAVDDYIRPRSDRTWR